MKDTFYFRHDYGARNDERILELRSQFGTEGYGAYFMLIEMMAESGDGHLNGGAMGGLSLSLGVTKDRLLGIVESCVHSGLFVQDSNGRFTSPRIQRHKAERKFFSEQGKKGAKISHSSGGAKGGPKPGLSQERRVEESKEEKKYVVRPETESLYETIGELCTKYDLGNQVNKKALDVIVERYVGKIHMKVEVQHCIAWLIGKNFRTLTSDRVGNWFKKAQEIQKRDDLRQKELKEQKINPAKPKTIKPQEFNAEQSIRDFAASQDE